jgi:hypothetical protein
MRALDSPRNCAKSLLFYVARDETMSEVTSARTREFRRIFERRDLPFLSVKTFFSSECDGDIKTEDPSVTREPTAYYNI